MEWKEIIDAIEAHPVTGTFLGSSAILLLSGMGCLMKCWLFPKPHAPTMSNTQTGSPDSTMNVMQSGDVQSTNMRQSPHHQGEGDMTTTFAEKVVHNHGMSPEERDSYVAAIMEAGKYKALYEKSQIEIEELRETLVTGIERAMVADNLESRSALEAIHEEGDPAKLIAFLKVELRSPEADLIEINREIAAMAYLFGDIASAKEAVDMILRLEPNDIDALFRSGHIHALNGEIDEAEKAYMRVLNMSEEKSKRRADAYGNLGNICQVRGELENGLEFYRKAMNIQNLVGDQEGLSATYGNIGFVHETRGEFRSGPHCLDTNRGLLSVSPMGLCRGLCFGV